MYKISVTINFSAAHRLGDYEGPCENLHGHNWLVKATVGRNELDEIGMAYDFKKLKNQLKQVVAQLDHQYLNDIAPFNEINPTSENIARYIFQSLKANLPQTVNLIAITVGESEHYLATYEESC